MAHDATVRQIEIIGEAAGNVSNVYREEYDDLPWGKMK
jgi:uncharacterized protein with HEPN domain